MTRCRELAGGGSTAVVFDMDGVLIDSGAHHRAAWAALCADLNVTPPPEFWRLTLGRPAEEVVRYARARGIHPGYPVGRDYGGLEDVLLVAVTERRTPEEIDRLAAVLQEACA